MINGGEASGQLLTCLIGMALPLPMLSVLLSTLFVCSLAFRDCKRTRKSVRNSATTHGRSCGGVRWWVLQHVWVRQIGWRSEGICVFVEKYGVANKKK